MATKMAHMATGQSKGTRAAGRPAVFRDQPRLRPRRRAVPLTLWSGQALIGQATLILSGLFFLVHLTHKQSAFHSLLNGIKCINTSLSFLHFANASVQMQILGYENRMIIRLVFLAALNLWLMSMLSHAFLFVCLTYYIVRVFVISWISVFDSLIVFPMI